MTNGSLWTKLNSDDRYAKYWLRASQLDNDKGQKLWHAGNWILYWVELIFLFFVCHPKFILVTCVYVRWTWLMRERKRVETYLLLFLLNIFLCFKINGDRKVTYKENLIRTKKETVLQVTCNLLFLKWIISMNHTFNNDTVKHWNFHCLI